MRRNFRNALLLTLFVCSCSVGPKYEPPCIDIPCEWRAETRGNLQSDSVEGYVWWESLHDPLLNWLICQAAQSNLDLSIAMTRVLEARRQYKASSSAWLPSVDAAANYGHVRYNQKALSNLLGIHSKSHVRHIDLFEAGFDASWELDLFGKKAHDASAGAAQAEAASAEYCNAWVTISAEVARTYIELRGFQQALAVLDRHVASQKESCALTSDLMHVGMATTIDQKQAAEQVHLLLAKRPQLQFSIEKAMHRLSLLLGFPPGELCPILSEKALLPEVPCEKPIGVPSELLRRRPDIIKAERELAAATERVGSAIAALFPRLSLRGFIGDITTLCSGSYTWYAGPQLLMPIFNSKLLEQDVDLTKIRVQQALYGYQKAVLESLEEAENAIAAFNCEQEKNRQLAAVLNSSLEVYCLAMELYQKGFKNYLDVLMAYHSLLAAEDAYLQSQLDLLFDYIALYKSLGGGWDQ